LYFTLKKQLEMTKHCSLTDEGIAGERREHMLRCKFAAPTIVSAGYDPLHAVLEVEFAHDGQVWQYLDVPEEIWYRFKRETEADYFFHAYIKGCYDEKRVLPDVS